MSPNKGNDCDVLDADSPVKTTRIKGSGWGRSSAGGDYKVFEEHRHDSESSFGKYKKSHSRYPAVATKERRIVASSQNARSNEKFPEERCINSINRVPQARSEKSIDKFLQDSKTHKTKPKETYEVRASTFNRKKELDCMDPQNMFVIGANAEAAKKEPINIIYHDGQRAKVTKPRKNTESASFAFASNEAEGDVTQRIPEQRRMELLIKTSNFWWRQPKDNFETDEKSSEFDYVVTGDEVNPWMEASNCWEDEQNQIKCCRIELKQNQVSLDGELIGRIFFELKKDVSIDSVDIEIDYNLIFSTKDGESRHQDASKTWKIPHISPVKLAANEHQTSQMDTTDKVFKTVKLSPGTSAIPFHLIVATTEIPSFNYVNPDGAMVLSIYTICAVCNVSGQKVTTNRASFCMPSYGMQKRPIVTTDVGSLQLGLLNKYVTPESGPSFAICDETDRRGKGATMSISRTINCAKLGTNQVTVKVIKQKYAASKKGEKSVSPVADLLKEMGQPLNENCRTAIEHVNAPFTFSMPSVCVDGFSCDYSLQLQYKHGTYGVDLIACDYLLPEPFTPKHVGRDVVESCGWSKKV